MRITINVNGQDIFDADVIAMLNMLAFNGKQKFAPPVGSMVVIHAESDESRITEKFTMPDDEEDQE